MARNDEPGEEVHIGHGPRIRLETAWVVALAAIVGMAVVAGLVVFFTLGRGSGISLPTAAPTPIPTPVPVVALVPTATLAATPLPTPTAAPPPTATPRMTPTPVPTATPTPPPRPTPVPPTRVGTAAQPSPTQRDSSAAVASDIPGTPLSLGASRTSGIDKNLKPRDLYVLQLSAGQLVQIAAERTSGSSTFDVIFVGPDSKSFQAGAYDVLAQETGTYFWTRDFSVPVSGSYYLAVIAQGSGLGYKVSVAPKRGVSAAGAVASDIPGTALAPGASREAGVDKILKPRDVYALQLAAGQLVNIGVFATSGPRSYDVILVAPGSRSFDTGDFSELYRSDVQEGWRHRFVPLQSASYYLAVSAKGRAQGYRVSLSKETSISPSGTVESEIPGTPLALGSSWTSIVDLRLKPRDVYALTLTAGQEVRISLDSQMCLQRCELDITFAAPGSASFQAGAYSHIDQAMGVGSWRRDFVAPLTGTYFLAVLARYDGIGYTVSLRLK